jgi:hypothetical protein
MKRSIRETTDILHPQTSTEEAWPQGLRPSQWWAAMRKDQKLSLSEMQRRPRDVLQTGFVWKDIENAECQ